MEPTENPDARRWQVFSQPTMNIIRVFLVASISLSGLWVAQVHATNAGKPPQALKNVSLHGLLRATIFSCSTARPKNSRPGLTKFGPLPGIPASSG